MESGQRRTIYYVWNYVEWGGAQVYLFAIMKAAVPEWDVVAIIPESSDPAIVRQLTAIGARIDLLRGAIDPSDAPTIRTKLARQWKRILAEFSNLRHLRRYDLRNNILHIETAPWQSWFLLTALAFRGANTFVTLHNFLPVGFYWRNPLWRIRMWFVSRLPGFHIFAANLDTKNKLKGWVPDRFWEEMPLTHTAVNPDEIEAASTSHFYRTEMRVKFGIGPEKFLVLCVGQFIDRKGRWVFLDAARILFDEDPDLAFAWLTPSSPSRDEMERVRSYGLEDAFTIVVSSSVGSERTDILNFFRIADVFALPSFVEGLPIALMEAMALGLPSISTNVNSIPEAVIDHETGILVEPGNADRLADAIVELRHDSELRSKLARMGRKHILERFDERKIAHLAIDHYKAALGIE